MTKAEKALLWVIYEQCAYNGKAYAKLLIHGHEAFDAVGIVDECPIEIIENKLFSENEPDSCGVFPAVEGDANSWGSWWYICPKCNIPIDYNDSYCRHCGVRFFWSDNHSTNTKEASK